MNTREDGHSDAAAFVYIRSCLRGRAYQFRRKRTRQRQRERLTLNEPLQHNGDTVDRLSLIASSDFHYDPTRVTEMLTLQDAMKYLTPKERRVIEALFFRDEKVVNLCRLLHISKNSVLKTKRRALKKLRKVLQKPYSEGEEERS